MTCRDLADFLLDYIEGELPEPIRRQFDAHVAECPDCLNYLQQYRNTVRLTGLLVDDMSVQPMPPDLVRAIVLARG